MAKHKEIALKYVESIKADDRIIAVLGLGSLARNYADEVSDIDLGIIFSGNDLPIPQGEFVLDGYPIDRLLLNIDYYREINEWPLWMRECFSSAILLYSRDSRITETTVRNHVAPRKEELQYLAAEILLDLAWHGIALKKDVFYGTPYELPSEDFLFKRVGSKGAAIYHNFALEQILRLFFIASYLFPPTPKWLLFHLPIRKRDVEKKISQFMSNNKREQVLIDMLKMAVDCLREAGVMPKNLFEQYTSNQQKMKWGRSQYVKD